MFNENAALSLFDVSRQHLKILTFADNTPFVRLEKIFCSLTLQ